MRAWELNTLDQLYYGAALMRRPLEAWAFDSRPLQLCEPDVPSATRAPVEIKRAFLPRNEPDRHVTRPALLLQALAAHLTQRRAAGADLVILTDGDDDDCRDAARLPGALRALCARHGVHIQVLGIRAENLQPWTRSLPAADLNLIRLAGRDSAQQEAASLFNP